MDTERISAQAAGYRITDNTTCQDRQCMSCVFFDGGNDCSLVLVAVQDNGLCNLYSDGDAASVDDPLSVYYESAAILHHHEPYGSGSTLEDLLNSPSVQ